ncbi:hypothetical protein RPQ02_40235 [Streptomyces sp. AM2-3-1]|uniref:hypothetical protein n=1 Tax=Streptomyces sp. AM2-3-1 TaxID=3075824 RepID=UPI0028C44AC1|nr:hypothetical protein [Streptomyces sp. AM2-3-1]WNO62403.1 hypothetical protein RPQ02_00545 [Streptomyces sp. AM2-3-1]WNO69543.1 hypothetical protein RPQ02_40235 [Streptomyces sp. AM2-3-1]
MTTMTASSLDRALPTNRANLKHQEQILLAAIRLSGPDRLVVKSSQIAAETKLGSETVTECLRFFATVGLVAGSRGRYAATAAGAAWADIQPEDHTRGRLLLHNLFKEHWSARDALAALADGPVESEAVAQHLRQGLPGNERRGMYLIEWLVEALVIHRDRYGRVHAPATGQLPESVTAPVPSTRVPVREEGLILGMTTQELRCLPTAQYVSLLRMFTDMVDQVHASTS